MGKIRCFFQLPPKITCHNLSDSLIPKLVFQNNTAGIAGGSLYGGWVDLCVVNGFPTAQLFKAMFHFQKAQGQSSVIPLGFVYARMTFTTATLPSMSQPTLITSSHSWAEIWYSTIQSTNQVHSIQLQ